MKLEGITVGTYTNRKLKTNLKFPIKKVCKKCKSIFECNNKKEIKSLIKCPKCKSDLEGARIRVMELEGTMTDSDKQADSIQKITIKNKTIFIIYDNFFRNISFRIHFLIIKLLNRILIFNTLLYGKIFNSF